MCKSIIGAALALSVFAGPAFAEDDPKKLKILVMELKVTAIDSETAALVAELTAVKLSQFSMLEVFGAADVRRLMELEADKMASGCEDDSSCIADIAGALGARYVIYGRLGKLGTRFICTLNLFDADQGKAIGREDIKAQNLDELSDQLEVTLDSLVSSLVGGEKIAKVDTKTVDPVVRDPEQRDVPRAVDTENEMAFKLFLIGGGGALAGVSYAISAITGAIVSDFDPPGFLLYLPVLGPALYPSLSFDGAVEFIGPFCYTCSIVQLAGIGVMVAGFFVGGTDAAPGAPKRIELPASGPVVASLDIEAQAY